MYQIFHNLKNVCSTVHCSSAIIYENKLNIDNNSLQKYNSDKTDRETKLTMNGGLRVTKIQNIDIYYIVGTWLVN